jgi:hypothetical protein
MEVRTRDEHTEVPSSVYRDIVDKATATVRIKQHQFGRPSPCE